jgi:hypothetical protein
MYGLSAIQMMIMLHVSRWMAMAWTFGFSSISNEFLSLAPLPTEVNICHQVATPCVIHGKQNGAGMCFSSYTMVSSVIVILPMPGSHILFIVSSIKSELTALLNERLLHFFCLFATI